LQYTNPLVLLICLIEQGRTGAHDYKLAGYDSEYEGPVFPEVE